MNLLPGDSLAVPGTARTLALPAPAPERLALSILRLGAAACFIGHGIFGLIGKEAWLAYFGVFGIADAAAYRLMPLVGGVDVAVGLAILVRPHPAVLAYMAVWALWTAMLRPLAGEPAWEVLERAGNYGVPLALLVARGGLRAGRLDVGGRPAGLSPLVLRLLALTTALLLLGHGALAVSAKPLLVRHLSAVGLGEPALVASGWLEIALAALIAARPSAALALAVAGWKLATEGLFLAAGEPIWELVERGGSYAAPLALAMALRAVPTQTPRRSTARATVARVLPLAAGLVAASAPLLAQAAPPRADAPLLASLRQGGYVLACRHTVTDHDTPQRTDLPVSDRRSQRNLNEQGERDARELGRMLRELGVPVGPVAASPAYRTWDTAVLAFGRADTTSALTSRGDEAERRALFFSPVPAGTNRVLISHQGLLISMFPEQRVGPIADGECLVIRPADRSERVVAKISLEEWRKMGTTRH